MSMVVVVFLVRFFFATNDNKRRLNVASWSTSVFGNVSLMSTNHSINTLQSLTNSSVNPQSLLFNCIRSKKGVVSKLVVFGLKLTWRLLLRILSLLHRDILSYLSTVTK